MCDHTFMRYNNTFFQQLTFTDDTEHFNKHKSIYQSFLIFFYKSSPSRSFGRYTCNQVTYMFSNIFYLKQDET